MSHPTPTPPTMPWDSATKKQHRMANKELVNAKQRAYRRKVKEIKQSQVDENVGMLWSQAVSHAKQIVEEGARNGQTLQNVCMRLQRFRQTEEMQAFAHKHLFARGEISTLHSIHYQPNTVDQEQSLDDIATLVSGGTTLDSIPSISIPGLTAPVLVRLVPI